MFKVGDQVVCVDDSPGWGDGVKLLIKDKIYTVLEVRGDNLVVIPGDLGWRNVRFRKVNDQWVEELLVRIMDDELVAC